MATSMEQKQVCSKQRHQRDDVWLDQFLTGLWHLRRLSKAEDLQDFRCHHGNARARRAQLRKTTGADATPARVTERPRRFKSTVRIGTRWLSSARQTHSEVLLRPSEVAPNGGLVLHCSAGTYGVYLACDVIARGTTANYFYRHRAPAV